MQFMIFQSRLTIAILLISVFAETGSSGSCGGRRAKTTQAANTSTTTTNNNMSSENKNEPSAAAETVWGGLHVRIVLTANGGEVEFDCAHGEIKAPVKADAQGRFDLPGTFVRERGGPVRADETESAEPVRYSGMIEGDKMSLTITLSNNNQKLDDFSLTRGNQGRLFKCK
jgi:hypothetical protein